MEPNETGSRNAFDSQQAIEDSIKRLERSLRRLTTGGVPISYLPLQNVSSPPAAPSTGGIIYVEGGTLKYVGSSGTRTTLAIP